MSRHYEWVVEHIDDDQDIVDHDFCESLKEAKQLAETPLDDNHYTRIVLVMSSDTTRGWAQYDGQTLEPVFEDAFGVEVGKVPQRYLQEAARG